MPIVIANPYTAPSYQDTILATSSATVIAYWPYNSLDAGVTPDVSGNSYDLTRNTSSIELDGVIKRVGLASMELLGNSGGAPLYSNQHLTRAQSFSSGFFNEFSVETWIYPSFDPNTARYILMGTRVDNQPAFGLTLVNGNNFPSGPPEVQIRVGAAAGGTNVTIPLNTWSHVVGTSSNSSGWKLYVDSVLIESNTPLAASTPDSTNLGAGSDYFGNDGLGSNIDEMVLYQGILSQTDITSHYNAA